MYPNLLWTTSGERKSIDAELIHLEDSNTVPDRHKRRLKAAESPNIYSFRIINGDGQELWMQLKVVVITWEGRSATLNLLTNIAPQKKLEAQLQ
ncbi:MAG: PAS domain S-box protein [Candidatus Aminicenantaceae bacterium]